MLGWKRKREDRNRRVGLKGKGKENVERREEIRRKKKSEKVEKGVL